MKIVVLVKEVPDTYGDRKLDLETGLADRAASETVIDEIGDAHANAPGRSYFAAGPTEGGWAMLMVWNSQEEFQRWAAGYLGPAFPLVGACEQVPRARG